MGITLFLHIGTEKTGSSYLQTLWAVNRDQLKSKGIWYPSAGKREADMRMGRISPGNGFELLKSLKNRDYANTKALLNSMRKNAIENECSKVLVSNEQLVEVIAEETDLVMLEQVCHSLDIRIGSLLLIMRDPVSQAISLFKHRAKNGNIDDVADWARNQFELHHYLGQVCNNKTLLKSLVTRRYTKDVEVFNKMVFNQWLEVGLPINTCKDSVNVSLTLDELRLIYQMKQSGDSWAVELLYNAFAELPTYSKQANLQLENYYKRVIEAELAKHSDVWQKVNDLLPPGEKLVLPVDSSNKEPISKIAYTFSDEQLKAITGVISSKNSYLTEYKFKIKFLFRRLISFLYRWQ